jgi:transcriptional regulator with XRE-family HTH domain
MTSPVQASYREGAKCPRGAIGRIEAGEVDPHYDEMIALADALGVTVGQLVGDAEALAG